MKALIKRLVEAVGPSGFESEVREMIRQEILGHVDEIRVDALGNLIARKGKPGGKRIMMAAHMDEIGVMVTHVDKNGFARFTTIGGILPHTCLGSRVRFINGVTGVIWTEMIKDYKKVPGFDVMYIDVGAESKETCPVKVGMPGIFDRPYTEQGNRLVSKAMDDRIATAILIEAIKKIKDTPNDLYFVFTVQEEVGLRGATSAAFGVEPEVAVAVDVTDTGDTPKGYKMDVDLGKGPAIKVMDLDLIVDKKMIDWMVRSAEKAGIPHQFEVLLEGSTDASAINLSRGGVPSICLSIPTRYIHTPSEMVDYRDVQNSVRLLVEMLSHPVVLE